MPDIEADLKRRCEPLIDARVYGIDEHCDIANAIVEMVGYLAGPSIVHIFVVSDQRKFVHEFLVVESLFLGSLHGQQIAINAWDFMLPDGTTQLATITIVKPDCALPHTSESRGMIFIKNGTAIC